MKALQLVRFGSPDNAFELRELPEPRPGAGEVSIDVSASGLNFADVIARSGAYPDCPPLPCTLGYEVVGRIRELGAGVTGVTVGQRVIAFTRFGGYASCVVTRAAAAVPIPDALSDGAAAALATQGATAWFMAEDTLRLHAGEHVLVQAAAGGVGLILVQLAKARGCVVYGTASSPEKLDYLRSIGVDHPIQYTKVDFADAIREIQGTTRRGLDVVYDSLGGSYYAKARKLLCAGGRIVCFGAAAAAGEKKSLLKLLGLAWGFGLTWPLPWLMESKGFLGVNMLRISDEKPATLQRCLAGVVKFWASGQLKLHVGGEFPAEQVAEAHKALGGRGTMGKVILRWKE